MRIAINGIGIAGPTLAFWLLKSGNEVILVERAAEMRSGGYVIDFWGLGNDIAEKMGIIPRVRELGYQVEEVRLVDAMGRTNGGFSVDIFGPMTNDRFTSVPRSDLAATIYHSLDNKVETLFGDSISAIEEHHDGVTISFEHAGSREVDLVVGADGLHSQIRGLAFGPEAEFEKKIGYSVAAFEVDGYRPRDELVYVSYGIPGRQVSRFSMRDDKTLFLFVFEDKYLSGSEPANDDECKDALKEVFADAKWETPQILERLAGAEDFYFDRVSQIRMETWSKGRTVLVGDAGACVSLLAGEGTGLAMAEAYVLAGELHKSSGDHDRAFANYQKLMMPFILKKQMSAAKFASAFAPKTAYGLVFRNLVTKLMRIPFIADYFVGRSLRDDLQLPDYQF